MTNSVKAVEKKVLQVKSLSKYSEEKIIECPLNELQMVDLVLTKMGLDDKSAKNLSGKLVEDQDYNVDFKVHVKGSVHKGKSYEKTTTTSIPVLLTLAFLVKRMGATRDAAIKALTESMAEAIQFKATDTDPDETYEYRENKFFQEIGVAEAQAVIERELKKLPKINCEGPVTLHVSVDVLK